MRVESWPAVVEQAATIAASYTTPITLRQIFYRCVAAGIISNTQSHYSQLSRHTAAARRAGTFPRLLDRGRIIHQPTTWTDPDDALGWLADVYRRDRTEGQKWAVYLAVEKAGMVEQLDAWFGDLGVPILALSGYASQSYTDDVADHAELDGRPAVMLYAGDHDPSGEDIDRDFVDRAGCFTEVIRVALNAEQVAAYGLPPAPGKSTDSRAGDFIARHGALVQVELDALDPNDLRTLYADALADFWDTPTFDAAVELENRERAELTALVTDEEELEP